MSLINQIQEDIKVALRGRERLKLITLRMLLSAIKQREIDTRQCTTDDAVLNIIEKQVQLRKEAAEQYKAADRLELFEKESEEEKILQHYLPEKLSEAELTKIIEKIISNIGAKSKQEMGRVMSELKEQSEGKIDMKQASTIVRIFLS